MIALKFGATGFEMFQVIVYLVPALGGFLVGLALGRWWSLTAALLFGVVVASTTEVEVSHLFLGIAYGGIAAVGICAGIATRRFIRAHGQSPDVAPQ